MPLVETLLAKWQAEVFQWRCTSAGDPVYDGNDAYTPV